MKFSELRNYVLLIITIITGTASVAVPLPEWLPSWVGAVLVVIAVACALAYRLSPDEEAPFGVPDWIRNERIAAVLAKFAEKTDGDPAQALFDLVDKWTVDD